MEQVAKPIEKAIIGVDIYAENAMIHSCGCGKVVINLFVSTPTNLERYILALYTKIIEDEYGVRILSFSYRDSIIAIEANVVDTHKIAIAKVTGIVCGSYKVLPPSNSIGSITLKDIETHLCVDTVYENDLGLSIIQEDDGTISFYFPECSDEKSLRIIYNRVHNINTGLKLRIPKGYVLQIFINTSMITKYGITIPGGSIYYTPANKDNEVVIPIIWDGDPRSCELDCHSRLRFYPSNTVIARGILLKYKDANIIKL